MISPVHNEGRCRRLIGNAVRSFDLDLSGLTVLTEAATGYYMLTPMIAALAGAERVLALARDSRFGPAKDVARATVALARRWGVAARIEVLFSRTDGRIGCADIVTNLGFVRPLNATFLARLKPSAVIPLMWEPWEFRPGEIDLSVCRRRGIVVVGTNEGDPRVATRDYLGLAVMKVLMEEGIEIMGSRLLLLGTGPFVDATEDCLCRNGACVYRRGRRVRARKMVLDGVACLEHRRYDLCLVGEDGLWSRRDVFGDPPVIVHVCGRVDARYIRRAKWRMIPARPAAPGYMSFTTALLGPRPVIDLHAAGLKVGQAFLGRDKRSLKILSLPLAGVI